jgi:hypothetical protein
MEVGSDKPPENEDAARCMEGRRRHETIRRLIDRHGTIHSPEIANMHRARATAQSILVLIRFSQ